MEYLNVIEENQQSDYGEGQQREILYDCDICQTKNMKDDDMYCCERCERNTCTDCVIISEEGFIFCSEECAFDWLSGL